MTRPINRIAVIGTGVIGASWAALFLSRGLEVVATDPAPGAEQRLHALVESFWPALTRIGMAANASVARLRFEPDLARTVSGADFIQENGPERVDIKRTLLGPFLNLHLSGGAAGIGHTIDHLGPPIESWWQDLGRPSFSPALREAAIAGVAAELAPHDFAETIRQRDDVLISLLANKAASDQLP